MNIFNQTRRIWIAGHTGMLGASLAKKLVGRGENVITVNSDKLDLRDESATFEWVRRNKPEIVFVAAAKVGGILANIRQPVPFLLDNLRIQSNVMAACAESGVEKLVFFGSSCMYPREAFQPFREVDIDSGTPELSNLEYASAKRSGFRLAQAYRKQYGLDYITIIPTNCYGPGDNFADNNNHVIPSLIVKFSEAVIEKSESVVVLGSGRPRREFIFVDDLADATIFLADQYSDIDPINVGTGVELTIKTLAKKVGLITGYDGQIHFDTSAPDGIDRKVLDSTRIADLGWQPKFDIDAGLTLTYSWWRDAASST